MGTIALVVLLFALLVGVTASVLAVTGRLSPRADDPDRAPRPWWGSPLVWLVVCGAFAFLGLVVAPRLFGGVFLFLPLIWVGRRRRRTS